MPVMTTVRLPDELEAQIDALCYAQQESKSQIIKNILSDYFTKEEEEKSSYELGEEYFGRYGSGRTDLSRNYKKLLKEKLRAKYGTH
jgi:predicted transcriptional regulator